MIWIHSHCSKRPGFSFIILLFYCVALVLLLSVLHVFTAFWLYSLALAILLFLPLYGRFYDRIAMFPL